ncbi:MAG: hypothetical protein ISR65_05745 [Bacteriovoracaceae bacterium]|nr:hypothetical protein [Bacteriovoracaceae bacterium]
MNLLDDPSMKEIVLDFCREKAAALKQMAEVLEQLEKDPINAKEWAQFAQLIDGIRGSAKSIGALELVQLCELTKAIGQKSSQISDAPLLNVVVAILFDTVDLLNNMISNLQEGHSHILADTDTDAYANRLKWLSSKFKDIEQSSVAAKTGKKVSISKNSFDNLIANLNL